MIRRVLAILASAALLSACVSFPDAPPATTTPSIADAAIVSADGARLGLTRWSAETPRGVIIAVHGMNDYAGAFALAGPFWAERGFSVYAYDQRGFGRSPAPGRWPGGDALRQDLRAVIAAVRAAEPGLPVFVVGHSMGCAVILTAMRAAPLDADGVILGAPGVWGGAGMPILYRATLNLAAAFAPGKTLTGERAGRQASDNIDFLRAMYEDPLVIKDTRLDAVLGVERLMGEAYGAADEVSGDILILTGEKDEIIPPKLQRRIAERLGGAVENRVFPDSWHMVFADLGREQVLEAAIRWIEQSPARRKNLETAAQEGNP